MRMLIVVAVLLATAACSHAVVGAPLAGEAPTTATTVTTTDARVTNCTDCERNEVEAAIDNPVVAQVKTVGTPPACEEILPLATISAVVDAPAHGSNISTPNGCVADYETADVSRFGRVLMGFSSPVSLEPVAISTLKGHTLIESAISDEICEYGLAINDALRHFDHGSWVTVRVVSADGNPPACGLARQLIEIAADNLPDAD